MSDFGSLLGKRKDEVPAPTKPISGEEYILKVMSVRTGEDADRQSGEPYEYINFGLKIVDGPGEIADMDTVWQRFRADKPKLISMAWDMVGATGVDTESATLIEASEAAEGREFRAKVKVTDEGWTNLSGFANV